MIPSSTTLPTAALIPAKYAISEHAPIWVNYAAHILGVLSRSHCVYVKFVYLASFFEKVFQARPVKQKEAVNSSI